MKVVGLLVSATLAASWSEGWATKSLNKWPPSHFALFSTSELKIKTVKFELLFSPAERTRSTAIKKQSRNNYRCAVWFACLWFKFCESQYLF